MSNRILDLLNMTYIQLKHRLNEISEVESEVDLLDVVRTHHEALQNELAGYKLLNTETASKPTYNLSDISGTPLTDITAHQDTSVESVQEHNETPSQEVSEAQLKQLYEEAANELNGLVGMHTLKSEVEVFLAGMVISKKKELAGHKTCRGSMHMTFIGPAGTGKTTVARIMAKLLYGLGYLSKGHCIETDREGLISGYVGQTATKTKETIEKAKGGVLFIDEAYSLIPRKDGFEQECIDTMVKLMEDCREDLLIIFAGYDREMDEFLESNSGLKSRIPYIFHFDAYSEKELLDIAQIMIKKKNYNLPEQAGLALADTIKKLAPLAAESNARMVRNLVERTEREQNLRLYKTNGNELMVIEEPDIQKAYDFIIRQMTQ